MENSSGFDVSFAATGHRMAALPWRQTPTYTDELFLGAYADCNHGGGTIAPRPLGSQKI